MEAAMSEQKLTEHEIECIRWRAAHDGWVKTEWKNQHVLNKQMLETIVTLTTRVGALEKRVIWVVAVTTIAAQLAMGYFFK